MFCRIGRFVPYVDSTVPPLNKYGYHQFCRTFFWRWLNTTFNQYDKERVKEAGADRACAEWLLRCGAHVQWKGRTQWETDYNALPLGSFDKYKIEAINADNAAVMGVGFKHFDGVKHLRKIRFKFCTYLDDDALKQLSYVKDTLEELEVSTCDISDEGLMHLTELKALKKLLLYDLPTVKDKTGCKQILERALNQCQVDFPDIGRDKGA